MKFLVFLFFKIRTNCSNKIEVDIAHFLVFSTLLQKKFVSILAIYRITPGEFFSNSDPLGCEYVWFGY